MMFEAAYNPYHPVFITPTYAVEPESTEELIDDWQQFTKRLRKRKIDVRYFVSAERGSQKGRLHLHAVLWASISKESYREQRAAYEQAWQKGFCLLRVMYGGKRGFNYAAKYILKDTIWYSYSRRPGLGSIGKSAFLERGIDLFLRERRIIDRVRIQVLGQPVTCRAHSGWRKELRDRLGIKVVSGTRFHYLGRETDLETYDEMMARVLNEKNPQQKKDPD